MTDDFITRFWEVVCDHEALIKLGFALPVGLIVLQLIASPGIERGSASFVIMIFNFALLVPLTAVMLYVIIRCSRHEPEDRF